MPGWVNESLAGTKTQKSTTLAFCLILLIAPHKFGNNASAHVFSFFPDSIGELLLKPWPLSWVPPICGLLLGLALLANRGKVRVGSAWPVWGPISLALAACIPGWVFAVNSFLPLGFTLHIASWLAFAFALVIHLRACPKSRDLLYAAMVVGIMLLCLQVIIEYFVILPLSREMLEERVRLYGAEAVPPRMLTLVSENRPQAHFAITNSLAAHLILVIPVLAALGIRWGKHIDPPDTSKRVMPVVLAIIPLLCLYVTKSRAAALAFCLAIPLALVAFAMSSAAVRKRYGRMVVVALALAPIGAIGAYLILRSGRGASSMFARFDYWQYAVKMVAEKPWTGVGLGEFFHNYLRLKPAATEITRHPHSMFFLFLSSCGILGAMAAVAIIASPLILWNRLRTGRVKLESTPLYFFSLAGVIAWILHSQADFNVHIPATVLTMTAVVLLSVRFVPAAETETAANKPLVSVALGLLAVGCLVGCIRIPGDYHLGKLENRLDQRQEARAKGEFTPALEGVVPLAKKASSAMTGCALPWEKVGVTALREKRYDVAAVAYTHVTEINPHFAAGHYRLAEALARLGRVDEARASFLRGEEWHPNNPEVAALGTQLFPEDVNTVNGSGE